MRQLLLTLLILYASLSAAHTATEDYDSLSQLSSQQLLVDGRNYYQEQQMGKALACFTIVSERYQKEMPPEEAHLCIRAMNNCGCVYKFSYFNYSRAYECFVTALDICEELDYSEFKPVILVNLGDLLNDYGTNYVSAAVVDEARAIFSRCITEAMENKNWEVMTTAFFNLANQNYDIDLSKYKMLFSDEIPDSTPDLQYVRLQYQGIEHLQQRRYEAARQSFRQQLGVINTRWEPGRDTLSTFMALAHSYYLEADYQHSIEYCDKALDVAQKDGHADVVVMIYKQMADNYKMMGDSINERAYYLHYLEKKETVNESRLASIGELNYVYQLRKEQQKAHEMQQRQQRQQSAMFMGAVLLFVLVVSALLLWRKNRQLSVRNKALFEKTQQAIKADSEQQKMRRNSQQSTEGRESLILRIQEVMDNPEMICQQDFTVARLAKIVESNTTYVSQAINEKYGVAFSIVLGSCRVKEACRRMNDQKNYGNHSIEGISTGVGFKSRTAFINAFKREVGLTPSEYLQLAIKEDKSL